MERKESTHDQILDVALKLFSENSYHGASIRDIAKRIDKRESSIYNHFKSKEDIFSTIISNFSERNFGPIILTDKLINIISKPEKFFTMLAENIIKFWNTEEERMFIRILLGLSNQKDGSKYSIKDYLSDFRKLCEFILKEMIDHKFIKKLDIENLSREFISPLFLYELELLVVDKDEKDQKKFIVQHIDFFWGAIKR